MGTLGEYLADKYYEVVRDEDSHFYPEQFLYNKSYSYMESEERYFPIPFNYEFCNDCRETLPYRIYHSEYDNIEEKEDKYRIVYTNNYKDLDGNTGNLNDLFINFSKLYALTDSSVYHIPVRAQQLQTNETSLYIGTGELFSIPPEQLKITDYQFGGSRFFKSRIVTEYGTVYVDDYSGRVFLLSNQLNDITLNGMRNFWQEEGKLYLDEQIYKLTGDHYSNQSTSSPNGIGYISIYDPRYKRLIIHKRDFKIKGKYESQFDYVNSPPYSPSTFTFDGNRFIEVDADLNETEVTLESGTHFENKSWTLSYSFISNSWVSYHGYLPKYMFNNYSTFFSFIGDDSIYKHNNGKYQTYYGNKYPFIVDVIASATPVMEQQYSNVFIAAQGSIKNGINNYSFQDDIFDHAIFYNNEQSTGKLNLLLKTSPFIADNVPGTALISRRDNKYSISNIRDHVIDRNQPIWDSSWAALQGNPFIYEDRVPNQLNINQNSNVFGKQRLKDYYLGIRLYSNKASDLKIQTDIINTRFQNRVIS